MPTFAPIGQRASARSTSSPEAVGGARATRPSASHRQPERRRPLSTQPPSGRILQFETDDVHAAVARGCATGALVLRDPTETDWVTECAFIPGLPGSSWRPSAGCGRMNTDRLLTAEALNVRRHQPHGGTRPRVAGGCRARPRRRCLRRPMVRRPWRPPPHLRAILEGAGFHPDEVTEILGWVR